MQSVEGNKRTRLCRLMCGKARPYRSSSTMEFYEAMPPIQGRASQFPRKAVDGKAQPFRTSGGVAANRSQIIRRRNGASANTCAIATAK